MFAPLGAWIAPFKFVANSADRRGLWLHKPLAVDLFAGAGGLSYGFAEAGFHVGAAVEVHPDAASTYRFNHPHSNVLVKDIGHVTPDEILYGASLSAGRELKSGDLDVLIGGPPCQGFSFAGEKDTKDPRNELIEAFVQMCAALRPKMAVMENVPGLLQMGRYRDWLPDHILSRFRDAGFKWVEFTVLSAEDYGVPQMRRRLFFVASRVRNGFEWPEATHDGGAKPYVTVLQALGDLDFLEAGETAGDYRLPARTKFQREMRRGTPGLFNHQATRHSERVVKVFSLIPEGRGSDAIPEELRTKKDGLLRLPRHGVSRAIVSAPEDLIHYRSHRIPTVRETARLQSFPDRFVFLGQRTAGNTKRKFGYQSQTQQVGNAVPPRLAFAVAGAVRRSLGT